MIYGSITELIGKTPMVEISGIEGQKARIAVKVESFNPGGSVKDRIALSMIMDAEEKGRLAPEATLVLTPGKEGMKGAIGKAEELLGEIPGSVILGQFTNPANPAWNLRKRFLAISLIRFPKSGGCLTEMSRP